MGLSVPGPAGPRGPSTSCPTSETRGGDGRGTLAGVETKLNSVASNSEAHFTTDTDGIIPNKALL